MISARASRNPVPVPRPGQLWTVGKADRPAKQARKMSTSGQSIILGTDRTSRTTASLSVIEPAARDLMALQDAARVELGAALLALSSLQAGLVDPHSKLPLEETLRNARLVGEAIISQVRPIPSYLNLTTTDDGELIFAPARQRTSPKVELWIGVDTTLTLVSRNGNGYEERPISLDEIGREFRSVGW